MLEFQKKRKVRRWLYSNWTVGVLLLLLLLGGDAVWKIYQKEAVSRANLVEAQKELERLKVRQNDLTQSVDRLRTPAGIEEEIRNKFSVVKDGEQVAIIVDSQNVATVTPPQAKEETFWQKMVRWFH